MAFVKFMDIAWPEQATPLLSVSIKDVQASRLPFLQQAELNRMASPYAALTASAYLLCFQQKPARLSINKQEP